MTDLPQLTQALNRTRQAGGHRVLYRFTLTIAGRTHTFDSLLAAEGQPPWPLLIALIGPHHWAHTYDTRPHHGTGILWTPAYLGADYRPLLNALGIGGRTTGPWPVSELLHTADHSAHRARPQAWISPDQLPRAARTDIEEADKTAFLGWHSWTTDPIHDGPSALNYTKTLKLLGKDIADHCRALHISSRWTTPDDPRAKHHDHRPTPPNWKQEDEAPAPPAHRNPRP